MSVPFTVNSVEGAYVVVPAGSQPDVERLRVLYADLLDDYMVSRMEEIGTVWVSDARAIAQRKDVARDLAARKQAWRDAGGGEV